MFYGNHILTTINKMKNLNFFLKLLIPICLSSCSNGQSNDAVLSQYNAQWKNDLNYLAEQLPKLHKNSFHTISKEVFQEQVNMVSQKIDVLNNDQIITELMQIG